METWRGALNRPPMNYANGGRKEQGELSQSEFFRSAVLLQPPCGGKIPLIGHPDVIRSSFEAIPRRASLTSRVNRNNN